MPNVITNLLGQKKSFDPESGGYDLETAVAAGMKPQVNPDDNLPHMGSVRETTPAERQAHDLPDESYLVLKGRSHPTWDLAVQGEKARGFKIIKRGQRYFSVPDSSSP